MISLILFFATWPFHHKVPTKPAPPAISFDKPFVFESCEVQDGLYWYMAEDGTIAFSGAGCEAAKSNIKTARILNQWKRSRI